MDKPGHELRPNHRPEHRPAEDAAIPTASTPSSPAAVELAEMAVEAGLRRVHILAWRDLVDVEAGGSELHIAKIAALWSEAGIEVKMRTSYAQGHPPEGTRDGYRVIRRRGRYMVFPAAVLAELSGRQGPRDGLVEIWNGVPFLSPLWARGPKITLLHHVHGKMWQLVVEGKLGQAGEVFERRVAPLFYRRVPILTLSESSRRELIDKLHFRPEQVTVVPPGVDPRFSTDHTPKSPTPLVAAVGRLMPAKRFDELIRIVHQVREGVPALELVIVGEGYDREELGRLVEDLDAVGWVTFAGRISDDELVDLYRRAWVVASASIAEGWGMTLTEAAACGTPAVVSDIAGHRDAVAHGHSGLLASGHREFVEHLSAVLTDEGLRRRLSDGARKHAAAFTWDATALGVLTPLAQEALRHRRVQR